MNRPPSPKEEVRSLLEVAVQILVLILGLWLIWEAVKIIIDATSDDPILFLLGVAAVTIVIPIGGFAVIGGLILYRDMRQKRSGLIRKAESMGIEILLIGVWLVLMLSLLAIALAYEFFGLMAKKAKEIGKLRLVWNDQTRR